MPTVAELQIVLEAQDRASAQLQQVGAQVARLQVQVEGVQRSGRGGGLLGALTGGAGFGAGVQAIEAVIRGVGGLFGFVGESIFGMNSRLERATAQFTLFTGSAGAAQRVITELRHEADITPFNTDELIRAGGALSSVSRAANVDLMELVRTAEALAAAQPEQGLEGAAFAIREAVLGGDFQSVIDRFNLSRATINRLREEGVPALQALQQAMLEVGATREQVEAFGRTFEGRASTITSFFDELRQRLGAGIFDRVSDLFAHLVDLIAQYGDAIKRLASDIGAALGAIAERLAGAATGPLKAFLDLFAPGLWQAIEQELATVPEHVDQITQTASRAAPAVESVALQLGRVGVAAAEVQLEADRVRRRYDDQVEPLQRQLRLLQQSADLQRVQNALATNRATVENLRLEQEVAALQQAAEGAEDPNAPGLTLRQRAIALALQERRLRQEELGLTEQQRPAVQSLEQQIAALQEQQRRALEPLERTLANYRDQADALKIVQQQTEVAKQADQERAEAERGLGRGPATPEALEDSRKRGEQIADAWLKAMQAWIDAGGGTVWGALAKTLETWWAKTGKPLADRVGGDLGKAIGDAAAASFQAAFAAQLETIQRVEDAVEFLTDPAGTIGRRLEQLRKEGDTRRTIAAQPRLSPEATGPNQLTGGGPNVTLEPGAVRVEGGGLTQEQADEIARRGAQEIAEALAAAAAGTDPGANRLLQGAR